MRKEEFVTNEMKQEEIRLCERREDKKRRKKRKDSMCRTNRDRMRTEDTRKEDSGVNGGKLWGLHGMLAFTQSTVSAQHSLVHAPYISLTAHAERM